MGVFYYPFLLKAFFSCSWLSFLNTRIIPERDTRSKLIADYCPWTSSDLKTVDAAIFGAIAADKGEDVSGPEECTGEGWDWLTPMPKNEGVQAASQPPSPLLTTTPEFAETVTPTATPTITGTTTHSVI